MSKHFNDFLAYADADAENMKRRSEDDCQPYHRMRLSVIIRQDHLYDFCVWVQEAIGAGESLHDLANRIESARREAQALVDALWLGDADARRLAANPSHTVSDQPGPCEKCGWDTTNQVQIFDRQAYWCGCDSD